MTKPEKFSDLFAFARETFRILIEEFRAHGLDTGSNLQLRKSKGAFCYFDLNDGHIYIVTPDPGDPLGKTQIIFLRMLLGLESDEQLLRLFCLFIPRIIAHELGHYYRRRHGLFGDDPWYEEQVANQLADAATTHRFSPKEKTRAIQLLEEIIASLSKTMESKDIGVDTYYNPLRALNASGMLEETAAENIRLMEHLFSVDLEDILKESGVLSEDALLRLERHDDFISRFNDDYTSNVIQYFYCQLEWMLLDLKSRERHYIQEFMGKHLRQKIALLPVLPRRREEPSDQEILTCFKAFQETRDRSAVCGRYFYKRYRALLLTKLQHSRISNPAHKNILHNEAEGVLEIWNEHELDSLELMMHMAPPSIHRLFPKRIKNTLAQCSDFRRRFQCMTDARLWKYVIRREADEHAQNTLTRLEILDKLDMYRALPARILIELTRSLLSVHVNPGETIIWEGAFNEDMFILIKGALGVFLGKERRDRRVSTIRPGGIFGEISFFTRETTTASVAALEESECLVLKSPNFRIFAFENPTVLMQMGRVLAQRFKARGERLDPGGA